MRKFVERIIALISLLANSKNINELDDKGFSALHLACNLRSRIKEQGELLKLFPYSIEIVDKLLAVEGIDINVVSNNNKMTALSLAIQQLQDCDFEYKHDSWKKILEAYCKENELIATRLITHGANIAIRHILKDDRTKSKEQSDKQDEIISIEIETTPLHTVLYEGKRTYGLFKAMVLSDQFHYKMLLVKDSNGNTVLDLVTQVKDKYIFKQLCDLLFNDPEFPISEITFNGCNIITFLINKAFSSFASGYYELKGILKPIEAIISRYPALKYKTSEDNYTPLHYLFYRKFNYGKNGDYVFDDVMNNYDDYKEAMRLHTEKILTLIPLPSG